MILFIVYVFLSSMGLILFKLGSKDLSVLYENAIFVISLSTPMILGIISYLLSFILWLIIVNRSELSYIYPLSIGFINIAILLGSNLVLHESITTRNVVGSIIIIIGIVLMKQ